MQLAILHYHLNPGGVTQVILNHLASLARAPRGERPERVAVLYGGRRAGWPADLRLPFEVRLEEVPQLEYDSVADTQSGTLSAALAAALEAAGFDAATTLVHAHNHALGKNASLPGALAGLAQRGYRLLLQVHDFIEDARPKNFRHMLRSVGASSPEALTAALYPAASNIHYAALTSKDTGVLREAGVPADHVHVLPNPIAEFRGMPSYEEAAAQVRRKLNIAERDALVVYPVRGIRRKNLGELVLRAALSPPDCWHALTLAPENPVERPSYDRWEQLAASLGMRCRWDIGGAGRVDFTHALAAADALVTTSVAEGFGMVFLESWLAGRPLVGRDLPEVTQDFVREGVDLHTLDAELRIPINWVDRDAVLRELRDLHAWMCRDYGVPPETADGDQLQRLLSEESVDFALLPTRAQAEVIQRVAQGGEAARGAVCERNPNLAERLDPRAESLRQPVEANAECVREHYSPRAIGHRLAEVYARVLASEPAQSVAPLPAGEAILRRFLRAGALRPVRLEP